MTMSMTDLLSSIGWRSDLNGDLNNAYKRDLPALAPNFSVII